MEISGYPPNSNLHYLQMNVNVDVGVLLSHIGAGGRSPLRLVTINFPDPLFKSKHKKRRVVTERFVEELYRGTEEGVRLFMQSDVKECLDDMRETFR